MKTIYCGFVKVFFQFSLICEVIIFPISYFSGGELDDISVVKNINSSSFSLYGYF